MMNEIKPNMPATAKDHSPSDFVSAGIPAFTIISNANSTKPQSFMRPEKLKANTHATTSHAPESRKKEPICR